MSGVKRILGGLLIGVLLIGVLLIGFGAATEVSGTDDSGTVQSPRESLLPAPKGLSATPALRGALLQWKPVRGADGYRIYWEREGGVSRCSARLDDVASELSRYEVLDLEPGVMYKFRVCTLRSSREGPLSRQVGVAPREQIPSGPSDAAP